MMNREGTVAVDSDKVNDGYEALRRRKQHMEDRQHAWDDPTWFVNDYLGRPTFDKQNEIAESLKVNRRTAVKGANGSGKDYMSGNIVNWWEFCWDDAITIVYGPTLRQVGDIIWREARRAFKGSQGWLPGYMYPKAPTYSIDEYRYAQGFSASPDQETGSGIQGFHSPHTLLIVTEAHAVSTAEIDALIRLNPYRVLLTGNTLIQSGEFFEAFYSKAWLYNGISISAFDTPNLKEGRIVVPGMLNEEDVLETAREYGADSPMYKARVLAEFPDNLEDAVVSRRDLDAAVARGLAASDVEDDEEEWVAPPASYGCDVARFGDDDTVVYRRQGNHNYKAWETHGKDTVAIAGRLRLMAQNDPDCESIIIDDTGVGGGVTDNLRVAPVINASGKTVRIIAFRGGSRAVKKRLYVNLISEAWVEAGRQFRPRHRMTLDPISSDGVFPLDDVEAEEPTITIDKNTRLMSELASRSYKIQGDARFVLEKKEDYKKRTRKSPDHADAFAMNYSPLVTRGWGPG